MFSRVSKSVIRLLSLACAASIPLSLCAQVVPAANPATGYVAPKWDIFAGYSFLAPNASVKNTSGGTVNYDHVAVGGEVSGSYYFNRYVGAQLDFGIHEWGVQNGNNPTGTEGNNDGFTTIAGGIVLRYPTATITPFAHALFGAADIDGPAHSMYTWGPAVTAGAGLDYQTPWWQHRISIRLIQADYEYMHTDFAGFPVADYAKQSVGINAMRISAGIVFHPGWNDYPPVTLSCSASPDAVYAGDPVSLTAVAGNLNPKLNTVYTWSGSGVTGNGMTATVATTDLAAGAYTVNCGVKEGKKGKEGMKAGESADATTHFTVKPFEPPTVSCSANPSTIKPGDTSTITATGVSPQNRPLTYSYSATSGVIDGSGATAEFNSAGAPVGSVTITCRVSDDKGQSASADTTVTISAPPPPPIPHVEALCSITFSKDPARPTRVDNEAKACLDEVALDLQKQPDAKVVVVGNEDPKEMARMAREEKLAKHRHHVKVQDFAAERAVNAKEYLVTEKGIDASRVSVATSPTEGQTVEDYLVPSGANFGADVAGTTPVDEMAVKPVARKPLAHHHAHKKAAAMKAGK